MPYKDPDPTDPNVIVGMEIESDVDTDLDMAYTYAEEFARLGFGKEEILNLFRRPFYAGAHRTFIALGEEKINGIVDECAAIWGRVKHVDK